MPFTLKQGLSFGLKLTEQARLARQRPQGRPVSLQRLQHPALHMDPGDQTWLLMLDVQAFGTDLRPRLPSRRALAAGFPVFQGGLELTM